MYKVLLLCSDNSLLSPLAAGYFQKFAAERAEVYAAGVELAARHPLVKEVLEADGTMQAAEEQFTTYDLRHIDFDYILTFDEESARKSQHLPSRSIKYHYYYDEWGTESTAGADKEKIIRLRDQLKKEMRTFVRVHLEQARAS